MTSELFMPAVVQDQNMSQSLQLIGLLLKDALKDDFTNVHNGIKSVQELCSKLRQDVDELNGEVTALNRLIPQS